MQEIPLEGPIRPSVTKSFKSCQQKRYYFTQVMVTHSQDSACSTNSKNVITAYTTELTSVSAPAVLIAFCKNNRLPGLSCLSNRKRDGQTIIERQLLNQPSWEVTNAVTDKQLKPTLKNTPIHHNIWCHCKCLCRCLSLTLSNQNKSNTMQKFLDTSAQTHKLTISVQELQNS